MGGHMGPSANAMVGQQRHEGQYGNQGGIGMGAHPGHSGQQQEIRARY